ncbi:MAG: mucoidy inhibitor MuiA family protein [Bacteroidetes bacterium]|nr:mucoidy inhibitor MuiA family protein [Bacteroidota bacterium]
MKKILMMAFALVTINVYANDERNIVKSELKNATVYKSGAELTHTASANLKQGNNELVIDNIANAIDVNSIQIKTPNAVTLMGVEFNNNYLIPIEKSNRIKTLEDSVEKMQYNWNILNEALLSNNELYEVLRANRDLKGTQAGLSVAEVIKLMDYYKLKLQDLRETEQSLREKMKKIEEQKVKLQNQISEESKKNITTAGRLVLQLNAATSGKYDFTISYIANNAYWTPFYDVRVDDIKSPIKLITKAKIAQTTGIDWKQVKLSLSTSTPSQYGAAPILNAWYLAYINPVSYYNKKLSTMNSIQPYGYNENDKFKELQGRVAGVQVTEGFAVGSSSTIRLRGSGSISSSSEPLYVVNGVPMEKSEVDKLNPNNYKSVDVLKDAASTSIYGARGANGVIVITLKDGLDDYISVAENTLNLSYDIDLPYDVPTNGKTQTATIATQDIDATYKHYAVPKLDKDAYLLAEIADWGKLNLLPGEANIIFEGTYVGKSFIDPTSTNDTLNLTLGRDKRVTIKRDKLIDYSSIKFLGTNKLQKFTYQITVKNTKKEAINLLLKDQFPLTSNKEIEVELLDDGGAEVNTDLGILNWKIKLNAGESKKIKFTYTVKYPKEKTLNLN